MNTLLKGKKCSVWPLMLFQAVPVMFERLASAVEVFLCAALSLKSVCQHTGTHWALAKPRPISERPRGSRVYFEL